MMGWEWRRGYLAAGAALALAGCALPPIEAAHEDVICGQAATMIPNGERGCSSPGADGCAAFDAANSKWIVRYSTENPTVLRHEREHVCGMSHKEPWARLKKGVSCTEVTQAGATAWRAGDIMCRGGTGELSLETDAWAVEKTRRMQERSKAIDPIEGVFSTKKEADGLGEKR